MVVAAQMELSPEPEPDWASLAGCMAGWPDGRMARFESHLLSDGNNDFLKRETGMKMEEQGGRGLSTRVLRRRDGDERWRAKMTHSLLVQSGRSLRIWTLHKIYQRQSTLCIFSYGSHEMISYVIECARVYKEFSVFLTK
ncbi:hypothetical protein NE237_026849 [Protea cynaroides]|uniref:Uncharacterized protein n=1 Tax=Protea cynaroides TaxID=273540 RepID=A0A9Q0GLF3_9MAGN|nr:hypothetical protein NE237_026849 [Protea cynaroides]